MMAAEMHSYLQPMSGSARRSPSYGWRELDYVAQHYEFCFGDCDFDRSAGGLLRGRVGPAGPQDRTNSRGGSAQHGCRPEGAIAQRVAQFFCSRTWIDDGRRRRAHRASEQEGRRQKEGVAPCLALFFAKAAHVIVMLPR